MFPSLESGAPSLPQSLLLLRYNEKSITPCWLSRSSSWKEVRFILTFQNVTDNILFRISQAKNILAVLFQKKLLRSFFAFCKYSFSACWTDCLKFKMFASVGLDVQKLKSMLKVKACHLPHGWSRAYQGWLNQEKLFENALQCGRYTCKWWL